ncbi:MAG: hypothetical protein JSS07_01940 [Proteobacteria bacterium]|nr:hypothetical protein [Pseudomonadota bacterium]
MRILTFIECHDIGAAGGFSTTSEYDFALILEQLPQEQRNEYMQATILADARILGLIAGAMGLSLMVSVVTSNPPLLFAAAILGGGFGLKMAPKSIPLVMR